ncbi:lateral flagellar M-ring protein (FliF-like) [Escherichia coli]|uniref:Lateral flagellar M-ring protein (FliF-like) n=1 Tax=Escherichia coli TaxID=562 RepID=A0A2X1N433_ECOLX|nr:lateral flagellar M-ring protein (FliF-like) [Escherichia coli]
MNAQIKKLTQAFPAFRLRLVDNKRWALMAGVGLAVAATAIIVSVLWTGNRGYVSLYGRQENLPVSQIVTVLDGEKLSYRIDPQSGQILVPEDELSKTRMNPCRERRAGDIAQRLRADGQRRSARQQPVRAERAL